MKNKIFEAFCKETVELTDEIIKRATPEELDVIDRWWTWAHKSNKDTEQNFAEFIDEELPGLANRCATVNLPPKFRRYILIDDRQVITYTYDDLDTAVYTAQVAFRPTRILDKTTGKCVYDTAREA